MNCEICNKRAYSNRCVAHKIRKPIPKIGKRTRAYMEWRDTVAKPYLDEKYGRVCSARGCVVKTGLDVDHIVNRGSSPKLIMSLENVQYLCRPHHLEKTIGNEVQSL